jgi:hypothetical protein
VIAASYVEGWRSQNKDAVLVAPAHTFLMMNRPVTAQFWLDVGSSGWHQRLAQPLTHPCPPREWEPVGPTDADDETGRQGWSGRRFVASLPRTRLFVPAELVVI